MDITSSNNIESLEFDDVLERADRSIRAINASRRKSIQN